MELLGPVAFFDLSVHFRCIPWYAVHDLDASVHSVHLHQAVWKESGFVCACVRASVLKKKHALVTILVSFLIYLSLRCRTVNPLLTAHIWIAIPCLDMLEM